MESCTRSRPLGRRKNYADVTVTPTPARAILAAMCGRFTQAYTWAEVHAFLDLVGPARNLRPRYNIAPTTTIDVARLGVGGRELVPMRWGLVPSWWKKPLNELPSTFNARAESVAEKPMFQSAFKSRRCIIPASGFYEWTGPRKERTPHYFSSPSGEPLAFAGLWESWRDPESGERILSATIIVGARQRMDDALPRPRAGLARAQRLRPLAFGRCALRERRL